MRVRITQFTDVNEVKRRLASRLPNGDLALEVSALLAFVDNAKARIDGIQGVAASIHLRKEFKIGRNSVTVVAGTVHGLIPTLWARMTT
jgi:hypothetical protein